MSGFVALVNVDGAPVDPGLLDGMTAALAFRGPDGSAVWADGHVGLGHRLLRTTDESAREAQPCTLGDDVWIAADARIDGRRALVQRLRGCGRPVGADATDPDLVLHAYLAWGDACLEELIGDFAFVLWDGRRQRLLAARDQLGVAQLFHVRAGGSLLVGNTLQALLRHPEVPSALDGRMLADVALFTIPLDDAATAYAAIRRVPAGHKLVHDGRGVRIERYWSVRDPAGRIRYRRPEEYAEHFRHLFDEAVADRLRTDRAGTQLSGGMDSSSIAVAAHRWLRAQGRSYDLRAYTIDYGSLIPDEEGGLAEEVARSAGFPVEVLAGDRYLDADPRSAPAWAPPEPGATTIFPMAELCARTTAFARVLLTGYGGDPLLAAPDLTWRRAGAALREGDWRWPAGRLRAGVRRSIQRRRPDPLPAWVDRRWAREAGLAERVTLFRLRVQPEQSGMAEASLWRGLFAYSDAGYNGLPLSIRFPFFDLRLLDFVRAIPPTPWLRDKRLLRQAVGDRLPASVATRPKTPMPGSVALERNRRAGVPGWELDLLSASEMAPYVDADWLDRVRAQPAEAQALEWASQRPPIQLAYWLRHRPGGERSAPAPTREASHARARR